jgi:hypothetical protein
MSYFEKIISSIDDEVEELLIHISNKFNIDQNELLKIWTNKEQKIKTKPDTPKSTTPKTNTPQENTLLKLSSSELKEMCKSKGLKVSGTKNDLVARIIDSENNKKNSAFSLTTSTQTKSKEKDSKPPVLKKLVEKIPVIEIKKNKFGNFEHSDTSLLYDNKSDKIYGKQNPDGTIAKLTKDDIDICNKYKFSYVIPENLDNDDDVEVEYEEVDADAEAEVEADDDLAEEEYEEEEDEDEEEIEVEDEYYDE